MISELFSGNVFLWTCVWQSTVCVAVGLVGSFLFRHWPARAHRVLFVAMIVTVIVPILSSLVRYFELGVLVAEPAVIQSGVEDLPRVNNYEAPEIMGVEDVGYKPAIAEEYSVPATVAQSEGVNIPWGRVILWGWVAASLFLTVRLFVTFLLGVRLLSQALPLGCEKIRDAVHVARAKLGFGRNVEVYSSAGVCSPVIWCWGRQPVLLVPSAAAQADERLDWISVLCHELAHWKRRDHISGLLAELMVCIFPWNPLMWLAKRRLVSLSEQACDDWVLASGQLDTNYAQSLLDLAPQGQMAFVPAVVSSKKALGARIRRILKDRCGQPLTGRLWALVVGIVAMSVAVGIAFAQTRPAKTVGTRIVHFPKDRSLGTLKVQTFEPSQPYKLDITGYGDEWQYFGQAVGDVTVPAGKRLQLVINRPDQDLSPLRRLRPADLYMLIIDCGVNPASNADVTIMPHLSGLTELKVLYLFRANITGKGLRHIRGFKSLRRLILRLEQRIDNAALAELANLESLQELVVNGRFTDTGLRHLEKLTLLRELSLEVTRVRGPGLAYLEKLPQLRYLQLVGQNFGDDGLAYVKNLKSLKKLHLFGQLQITDAGLAHLSNLTGLEELKFTWIEGITDAGLVHLKPLSKLKKLDFHLTKLGDKGIAYLRDLKSLESLEIRGNVTDQGLADLSELEKLEHLIIGGNITDEGLGHLGKLQFLETLWIDDDGITDAGMSYIAKLTNLKELLISSRSITDQGLANLTELKSLKRLYLHDAKLTVSGLSQFNALPSLAVLNASLARNDSVLDISGMTNLEKLSLGFAEPSGQYWTDADLVCLAKLSNLKWLQIHPRKLSDAGMVHLRGLTNLERLGIGGGKLTDDGLLYLANMNKLNHLTISDGAFASGGNLTDKGLRHLERFKALSYLSVNSDKDFSPAALQQLRNKLPNLATLMVNEKNGDMGGMGGIGGIIESDAGQRVLHFPKDHSIGMLKIQDAETVGRIKEFYNMGKPDWWSSSWEFLGEAKGDVVIPAGKVAALRISEPQQWRDLSGLSRLNKDDLYFLCIEGSKNDGPRPGDACMKHIAHLTGLKRLEILYTYMTVRGLQQIERLKSLETLVVAGKFNDAGLGVISKLPSLKNFYICHFSQVTNAGMRHVGQMELLEELVISGDMVGDEGLVHLSKLPRLRYLRLYGQRFTDEGMIHLSKIPNLKYLQLNWLKQLTDKALMHIAACDNLETVSFYWNENITNKGAEYLSTIKSLKSLDVHNSQITDEGVKHLSQIKSLEHLHLPYRNIGDRGLGYLSNLGNLRHLSVARDHIIDPEKDKGFYTDKGVKELSKLSLLEELSIGSRGMSDESMDYISSLTKLKVLRLGQGNTVTDKGIAKLKALTSLEELGINYANMTISGLSALNNLSNLKQLDVEGMKQDGSVLDISGMTKLERLTLKTRYEEPSVICDEDLACLVNLKDLKQLYIRCAEQPMKPMVITDKGMANLEGLTKMEDLGIGGILTDEGLKSLRNMQNMWRLSIYGGRFTDKGLRHLEGFRKLRMLTIIEAEANFSPQALQRLREKMPILHTLEIGDMDQLYGGMGGGMGGYAGKN